VRAQSEESPNTPRLSLWRLLPGPIFFVATLLMPAPSGFEGTSWQVLGLVGWMALWWALEAIPLAATALLPIIIVPLLGVPDARTVLAEYANPSVLLLLGGFLVALAMERWQLHRRMAFAIMLKVGTEPRRLVLGMMLATAFISLWVSNTSSALMMLPVAIAIASMTAPIGAAPPARDLAHFTAALLLAVAYGATIGGMGTLIGTPTNALVQGFMARNFGVDITFLDWLAFGLPTVALLLPAAWFLLVRVGLPFDPRRIPIDRSAVHAGFAGLGGLSIQEKRVAVVAIAAAVLWVTRPWLSALPGLGGLDDTVIAVAAGLSLFLIPSGSSREALLRPSDLAALPWTVLLLFGGGLALAAAIQESTLAQTLGVLLAGLGGWPLPLLIIAMVLLLIVWTELNSNVSTAATFMPIMAAVAAGSEHSVLALVAPAAMAASAGFMLPVGTPANALVFGSGRVSIGQMLRAGWSVNLAAAVVISTVGYFAAGWLASR
jgi:solute carrier family 13 (sodium-dependent dicarboxylate transporter), member 2/3/5